MVKYVRKRDGKVKPYSYSRIEIALEKAFLDAEKGEELCFEENKDALKYVIERELEDKGDIVDIEAIQDIVIDSLKELNFKTVSDSYSDYRRYREIERNKRSRLYENILGIVNSTNEDIGRENSNKNGSLASTQRDLIAGEVSKEIADNILIPPYIVRAHEDGDIHWHDKDYTISPIFNCCLLNLEDMLNNGTIINEKLVEEPRSFSTACTVATQIIAQISSNQHGGQSITIKHLAKYLSVSREKYKLMMSTITDEEERNKVIDDLTMKELKDGVQTIRYQLSTLQTTNGQAPFCSVYLEIEEGHPYEKEMALICEEMIKQRLEGMKNYKGQEIGEAFPKLVYLLDEHNCLEGGKYDYITKLCAKCNVKRLVPDYQSAKIMRKNYEGNTFPPMGK